MGDMSVEDKERQKYELVWSHDSYRHGPGERLVDDAVERLGMKQGESVADYGCGEGIPAKLFDEKGFRAINLDITEKALAQDSRHIPFVESPLWRIPKDFPVTDWFFCTDVLEHIPTDKVRDSLKRMALHTAKGGYIRVAHWADAFGPMLVGESLHLTQRDADWWKGEISEFFEITDMMTVKNNGRSPTTYLVRPINPGVANFTPPEVVKPKSAKSVIIVGHGPSAFDRNNGYIIDKFRTVIRFALRRGYREKAFGTKTDIIVASMRSHSDVVNDGIIPKETWIFSRPNQITHEKSLLLMSRLKKFNPILCREVWPWMYRYQELGATGYMDPQQGEAGMIPSFTQGLAAIIMACHRLNPKQITLVGFDNLMAGTSQGYQSSHGKSLNMKPWETRHDLATEKKLIPEIMKRYDVSIVSLTDKDFAWEK